MKLINCGVVQKIRKRYDHAPEKSFTVESLIRAEDAEGEGEGTEALLWLTRFVFPPKLVVMLRCSIILMRFRALDFIAQALRRSIEDHSEELATSFRAAYSNTLKKHHSFFVKPIGSAAMSAVPYRQEFYTKLGEDQAKVESQLRLNLDAAEKVIGILKSNLVMLSGKWTV